MNEKNKIFLILGILVALIAIFVVFYIIDIKKGNKLVDEINTKMAASEPSLIYISSTTCQNCVEFEPTFTTTNYSYGIEYVDVVTDDIRKSTLNKILDKLGITNLGTPYLAVVGNNKVISTHEGQMTEDELVSFYKESKLISKDYKVTFKDINYNEYSNLIKSKSRSIIVIGQTGCPACQAAVPDLASISKEYNVEINYLNLTNLGDDEEAFFNSLDVFSNGLATPFTIIVEKGKVIDSKEGYIGKDDFVTMFKDNGLIK